MCLNSMDSENEDSMYLQKAVYSQAQAKAGQRLKTKQALEDDSSDKNTFFSEKSLCGSRPNSSHFRCCDMILSLFTVKDLITHLMTTCFFMS